MTDTPSSFVAPRKILSPHEMLLISEASDHLNEARRLHEKIEEETEATKAKAQEDGFMEGYRDGRRVALNDLANAVAVARAKVTASESDLFAIMMTAIEQIIGSFPSQDDKAFPY
jgi:flagellar biosynthesis/type III secretory pathway protein FliH